MSTLPEPGRLRGAFVHCSDGERIGVVEDVYVDDEGGHARYLGIATDWFGGRLTVVPVEDVRLADADHLVLPYRADDLRAAPSYAVHDDLTISREAEIYGHRATPYWEVVRSPSTRRRRPDRRGGGRRGPGRPPRPRRRTPRSWSTWRPARPSRRPRRSSSRPRSRTPSPGARIPSG